MRALSGGGIVDMALRVRASPPRLLRLPGVVDFAAAAAADDDDDETIMIIQWRMYSSGDYYF